MKRAWQSILLYLAYLAVVVLESFLTAAFQDSCQSTYGGYEIVLLAQSVTVILLTLILLQRTAGNLQKQRSPAALNVVFAIISAGPAVCSVTCSEFLYIQLRFSPDVLPFVLLALLTSDIFSIFRGTLKQAAESPATVR